MNSYSQIVTYINNRLIILKDLKSSCLCSIFRHGTCIIGFGREQICRSELATFPQFLRFDRVELQCCNGTQSIRKKFELFESYLLPLKSALNDSNVITFIGTVANTNRCFCDNSSLIDYIENRFLQIFDSSRGYHFSLCFLSDGSNANKCLIATILHLTAAKRCLSVELEIIALGSKLWHLPVVEISNWLENSAAAGMEVDKFRNLKERIVKIRLHSGIQNVHEMLDHLKKVYLYLIYFQCRNKKWEEGFFLPK